MNDTNKEEDLYAWMRDSICTEENCPFCNMDENTLINGVPLGNPEDLEFEELEIDGVNFIGISSDDFEGLDDQEAFDKMEKMLNRLGYQKGPKLNDIFDINKKADNYFVVSMKSFESPFFYLNDLQKHLSGMTTEKEFFVVFDTVPYNEQISIMKLCNNKFDKSTCKDITNIFKLEDFNLLEVYKN